MPALVIAAVLMLQIGVMARPRRTCRGTRSPTARRRWHSAFVKAFPALLAPVILIGGLVSGYFGADRGGGHHRRLRAARWDCSSTASSPGPASVEAARETVHSTASVLFIVGSAALFAWVLTIDQVPTRASEFLLGLSKNPWVLLLIVNVILLVVGMIMESIAAILILAPIFTPALVAAGVDPVHLAVVVVLNLMIGLLTPPVGMSLYMVAQVARMPLQRVIAGRGSVPLAAVRWRCW